MVDVAKVCELREQLNRDRQGYANCCDNCVEVAAPFLEFQERNLQDLEFMALKNDPQNAWKLLPEIETRLNKESPTEENVADTLKSIRELREAMAATPSTCELATECLRILLNHLDVLQRKRTVFERVQAVVRNASDLREELQDCDALLKQNSDLRLSAELVFSHVEKTLAPALTVALDTPLQDTVTQ